MQKAMQIREQSIKTSVPNLLCAQERSPPAVAAPLQHWQQRAGGVMGHSCWLLSALHVAAAVAVPLLAAVVAVVGPVLAAAVRALLLSACAGLELTRKIHTRNMI